MNKLKVFFLPTANAGVVWQRMFQYFKYMREMDNMNPAMDYFDHKRMVPVEWQFPPRKQGADRNFLSKIQKLVEQSDVVVVGYIITDYGIAIMQGLKELFPDKPFLVDIDDYCLQLNDYSPAVGVFRPGREATTSILDHIALSNGVITTTPYLKRLYGEYNTNIKVVPNGIDFKLWDNLKVNKKKNGNIRIGWAGAATHNDDLKFIYPVMLKLLEKHKNIEFCILGGVPDFMKKDSRIKTFHGWKDVYAYPQFLKDNGFDIGVAPLLDNNFNRAKSNLRWLEYSALKIPTVASRVENFKSSITDGSDGFLATEPDEWEQKLEKLITDPILRVGMGTAAYNTVRKRFNIESISKEYSKILWEVFNESCRIEGKSKVIGSRSKNNRRAFK